MMKHVLWEEGNVKIFYAKRRIECEGRVHERICRETILDAFRGG